MIQKLISFDDVTKKKQNDMIRNWPQIPDYLYTILIIGCSGSGKTNSLFNLISQQSDTDKFIYMLRIHMKQNINF